METREEGIDQRIGARLKRDPELAATLEKARLRREAEQAAARRTRLHSFGIAGGRR